MAAAQDPADEQWVLMQQDSDAVTEVSLKEQDGDARGSEEESVWDHAVRQESAPDTEKYLWWLRLAWNDVWNDTRTYVLGAILSVHAVVHIVSALASRDTLQVLGCPRHFTTAMLCSVASSWATRPLAQIAVRASSVKKPLVFKSLLQGLFVPLVHIPLGACFAHGYYVRAGIKVIRQARRPSTVWYIQLLLDMVNVQALIGTMALAASVALLIYGDTCTYCRAEGEHFRIWLEAAKLAAKRKQERGVLQRMARELRESALGFICVAVPCAVMVIIQWNIIHWTDLPGQAATAEDSGI